MILACVVISLLVLGLMGFQSHWQSTHSVREQEEKQEPSQPAPSASYDLVFETNLPIIAIETDGQEIPYGIDIQSRLYVYNSPEGGNCVENLPELCISSTIHSRGQTSARFEKKSYGLEFYSEENGKKLDVSVLGMAAGHDWVLNGPYLDKSLMRNAFSYSLARSIMFYAPDTRYCEVYLNGEYMGLYLLIEAPRITETRINLSETALASGETSYLLQRNRTWESRVYTQLVGEKLREPGPAGIDTDTDWLNTFGLRSGTVQVPFFVVSPNTKDITAAQFRYIENDISTFERALYADFFTDEEKGYRRYIDLDSFAQYYLLAELSMNIDSGFYSTYVCKDVNGKLLMGPVWDFNNAYNNYVQQETDPEDGLVIADNNWFSQMTRDRVFVDAVVETWQQLRQSVLSEENMLRYLDETEQYLGDAIARNNQRWSRIFAMNMLTGDRDSGSYEQAQAQLRDFLLRRVRYLDDNLNRLYVNCVN